MISSGEINDSRPRNIYRSLLVGKKKNVFPRVHPLLTGNVDNIIDIDTANASSSFYLKPNSDVSSSEADAVFSVDGFFDLRKAEGLALALEFLTIMKDFQSDIESTSLAVAYRVIPSKSRYTEESLCKLVASAKNLGSETMIDAFKSLVQGTRALDVVASLEIDQSAECLELPEDLPADNFLVANGRYYEISGTSVAKIDVELLMRTSMAETKAVSSMLRPYVDSNYPHSVIAYTTAFLSSSKSDERSNPIDVIKKLEQVSSLANNPLRFVWKSDSGNAELKVRGVYLFCVCVLESVI